MIGRGSKGAPAQRSTVSWKSDFPPVKLRNCFGFERRDSGQSLVPDPPLRMIGMMAKDVFSPSLTSFLYGSPAGRVHSQIQTEPSIRRAQVAGSETHQFSDRKPSQLRRRWIQAEFEAGLGSAVFDNARKDRH